MAAVFASDAGEAIMEDAAIEIAEAARLLDERKNGQIGGSGVWALLEMVKREES